MEVSLEIDWQAAEGPREPTGIIRDPDCPSSWLYPPNNNSILIYLFIHLSVYPMKGINK